MAYAADPAIAQCLAASDNCLTARTANRLKDARALALVCAARSCPAEIRAECTKRAAAYGALIPTLVFDVKNEGGDDVSKVKVTMDGAPFADVLDGSAIEIDPGEHAFVFTSGDLGATKTLVLREGEKSRRERIVLHVGGAGGATSSGGTNGANAGANGGGSGSGTAGGSNASGTGSGSGGSAAGGGDAGGAPLTTSNSSGSEGYKFAGYVVGGVGIIGLGLGTYFGLAAASNWSSSQSECKSSASCPDRASAVSDHDSASQNGLASTIAFAAGGAAVTTGILLIVLSPSTPASKASAQASSGSGQASNASKQSVPRSTFQIVPVFAPSADGKRGISGMSAQGTF